MIILSNFCDNSNLSMFDTSKSYLCPHCDNKIYKWEWEEYSMCVECHSKNTNIKSK